MSERREVQLQQQTNLMLELLDDNELEVDELRLRLRERMRAMSSVRSNSSVQSTGQDMASNQTQPVQLTQSMGTQTQPVQLTQSMGTKTQQVHLTQSGRLTASFSLSSSTASTDVAPCAKPMRNWDTPNSVKSLMGTQQPQAHRA